EWNSAAPGGVITTPTPSSTIVGPSATFTWSAGWNSTQYWLAIGSGCGGVDYYSTGAVPSSTLSATATGLPANGSTIWATLFSYYPNTGSWNSNCWSYTSSKAGTATTVVSSANPSV